MNMRNPTRLRSRRGVAFMTALLMAVIFMILIGALLVEINSELASGGARGFENRALYAADAGVQDVTLNTEIHAALSQPPTYIGTNDNFTFPDPGVAVPPSFSATILKTWRASFRYYLIQSQGTAEYSGATRTVRAIEKSEPYTIFANFTITENWGDGTGGIQHYYLQDEQIPGPVYSGGPMHVNWSTNVQPIFVSTVRTPQQPIWNDCSRSPGCSSPATPGDWTSVVQGGQSNFHIGSDAIPLPDYHINIADASQALYGNDTAITETTGLPTGSQPGGTAGVWMGGRLADTAPPGACVTSGIYINGDANISATSVTTGGVNTQTFTLSPTGGAGSIPGNVVVAIDFNLNRTIVTGPNGVSAYCGTPSSQAVSGTANGIIFDNGNAHIGQNGITDTINGQYTLAVPDWPSNHSKKISMMGPVKYANGMTGQDVFGMWANDILITDQVDSNVEFDGSLITGYRGECGGGSCGSGDGTWYNPNWNTGSPQGDFTLCGALIENTPGHQGALDAAGNPTHGFSDQYCYDQRLVNDFLPPGFPDGDGKYVVIAWEDLGVQ